jgi:hypothetical protein
MLTFQTHHARQSGLSKVPFKAIFVDYRLIGTHEHIRHPEAIHELTKSILKTGYQGPPLAVFQAGSDQWFESASEGQTLHVNVGDIGIADGHHRLQAISMLDQEGLLQNPFIPVQLVPAHHHDLIRLASMRREEQPLPITAIEACFVEVGAAIPPSGTSHFQSKLKNGNWVRLAQAQPDIVIDRDHLLHT